jgi:molybdopterin molybdotransferase
MISAEAAWERIAAAALPLDIERVARRAARGRVLAAPLAATGDLPGHDVTALDGFALAGAVTAGAWLEVAGQLPAGSAPGARLRPDQALEIWTGAPIPAGADRIVAVESTERDAAGRVRVLEPPTAGNAIRRAGEIFRSGAEILPARARLSPAALALAASQGLDEVAVHRLPRLAVLATGDEAVPADQRPRPGGVRDSHTDYLLAAAADLGLSIESLGIAPDDPRELARRLGAAFERADVVLTCGGVSMGGADHLPRVFATLGCETLFHGVAIQPGKPLLVARRGAALAFGLPGNPASVMVAYRLFVRPALDRLAGGDAAYWSDAWRVPLAAPLAAGKARDRFVPARSEGSGAAARVRPLDVRGSHDLATFGAADRLIRVRAGDPARAPGEPVEVIDW